MKSNTTRQGFQNVLINGVSPGSIFWDPGTGLIVGAYSRGEAMPDDADGVDWMDGLGFEAYPAAIDLHVHDRFDELDKEDRNHLEAACFAGGVGTICTMPNNRKPFTHPDQLPARIERWKDSLITVHFNIGVSRENLREIAGLAAGLKNGSLGQVKEYDASTTNPSSLIDDEPTQLKAAKAIGESGRIKLVHAEYEPWLKRNRKQIESEHQLRVDDHCIIRSPEVEIEGIRRAIQICRETGVRTHFCHVSTSRGLELIDDAKMAGLPVTCETCPHYWRLHAGYLTVDGGRAKMNPALRSEGEMWQIETYIRQGLVDIISSDHAPHALVDKAQQVYDKCPSGVPGVETMVPLVYDLKARGEISAKQFINLTSGNAASLLGLNKGEIAPGKDADLILINPNQGTDFTDSGTKSKCGWTPFHGQNVSGSIVAVVLRGRVVKNAIPSLD